ncbi:hypothetical protein SLA2020_371920 [Shorea laevis]
MEAFNGTAVVNMTVKKLEPVLVHPAAETFKGLYFLSNIDQTFPSPIEIMFSYEGNGTGNENAADVMKESLAKNLVKFYPLAGSLTLGLDRKMHVQCTGEGVLFVEATSDCTLEELGDISYINSKFRELIHYVDGVDSILNVPLLTVQMTRFRCGGIVLGIAMNHILMDGEALLYFLKSWGKITRGIHLSVEPYLNRSILSPRQPPILDIPHPEFVKLETKTSTPSDQESRIYQSFCFKPQKLQQLKQLAKEKGSVTNPTSFEVISALMWIMRTKAFKTEPHVTIKLLTAVDVRTKIKPPMPECYFGNCYAVSCAACKAGDLTEKPFSFAVKIVQEAIKKVTDDYIKSTIDYYEVTRDVLQAENTAWISKWSRLPFYEIDFGWGEPVQVAPASMVWNLAVTISQRRESGNIILTLGFPESVMERFRKMMLLELEQK